MKKILAVSGGVDSMVMLDIFLRNYSKEELVVATFDHGTRESSKTDADFVEKKVKDFSEVCSALKIPFYRGEAKLGGKISEEKAREKRYEFLRQVARAEKGEIFTAHHLDDLVETTAINFLRGTGIRGLAGLTSFGIRRPFIDGFFPKVFDKKDILRYASEHEVVFRQDPTNETDNYLRNRVRTITKNLSKTKKLKIYELWKDQKRILREIEGIEEAILPEDLCFSRMFFREVDKKVGLEILKAGLERANISTTSPQREEFLEAILTYKPGKKFNLPEGKLIKISKRDFKL